MIIQTPMVSAVYAESVAKKIQKVTTDFAKDTQWKKLKGSKGGNMRMNKSHLTAITRKSPSRPMVVIEKLEHGFHNKMVLDYGCGKGFDAEYYGIDRYDPFYFPYEDNIWDRDYDVVTCNYVLNTVPKSREKMILAEIKSHLADGGVAYISVRRDKFKEGETDKGTYQRVVKLKLPVAYENSNFCIYKMVKAYHI